MSGLLDREDKNHSLKEFIEKIYVFVIMWSIGALLELDDRSKLQQFLIGKLSIIF